eukprot:SAG22_NODE_1104_length_5557_cov_11.548369_8_plen_36_part_01
MQEMDYDAFEDFLSTRTKTTNPGIGTPVSPQHLRKY